MRLHATAVAAGLLAAIVVAPPALHAQGRAKTDAQDFRMFLHSIAVRQNGRACERDVPEYGETFNVLYGRWRERHGARIARGESIFKEARTRQDLTDYPYTNRAALARIAQTLEELASPVRATAPATPKPQKAAACEKTLDFLRAD
jgi:hypothetical protein